MNDLKARGVANHLETTAEKKYPAKDFAKRLQEALDGHPHAPAGHGRQRWLLRLIEQTTGHKLSAEAVRKWFAGEARPRPAAMALVARSLEVDHAWLTVGVRPDATPIETKVRNAVANAAVNLVAGALQMQGAVIAFADEDEQFDILAIQDGKKLEVVVRTARSIDDKHFQFQLPTKREGAAIIGVVPSDRIAAVQYLRIDSDLVGEYGEPRGGFVALAAQRKGSAFLVGGRALPEILSFGQLDGVRFE